jgi:hypothetical protein
VPIRLAASPPRKPALPVRQLLRRQTISPMTRNGSRMMVPTKWKVAPSTLSGPLLLVLVVVVVAACGCGGGYVSEFDAYSALLTVVRVVVVLVCSLEHPNPIETNPTNTATTTSFLTLISGSSFSSGD